MGSIPIRGRSGLFERQINCGSGLTACGDSGCLPTGRCCNADAGWTCRASELCYTVSQTVDCYVTSGNAAAPTTARDCYDYTATGCEDLIGCFQCLRTTAPYCVTRIATGSNDIWLACNAVGGSDPTPSSGITARTSTLSSPSSSSTLLVSSPGTTSASHPSYTITPAPSISTTGAPIPSTGGGTTISTGAIAGIAIAGFIALSVIGVLSVLLYRKGRRDQPQPHPLMNDVDHGNLIKTGRIELSADSAPRMHPHELDSYPRKYASSTEPSELG